MLLKIYYLIHRLYKSYPVNSIYYRIKVREVFGWIMTRLVVSALMPGHRKCFGEIQEDYLISLTSFGKRVYETHKTILSLKNQHQATAKIILWLGEEEWNVGNLPTTLAVLLDERFEIRYVENLGSHKKYFFAMREFQNTHIIICDDDYIYPPLFVSLLMASHKQLPYAVHCHSARRIKCTSSGDFLPYGKWVFSKPDTQRFQHKLLPLGGGGVLFPKSMFSAADLTQLRDLIDEFKTTDDLLLLALLLVKGEKVQQLDYINKLFIPSYPQNKYLYLAKTNVPYQNDVNWAKLNEKFNLAQYFLQERVVGI
ncbi:hypothetical protein [Rhodonellum sp.]|uniref:hypothetical protein n=1 Tax=Rhodonellum sp. TaxID=2231180 RepID=UPI00271DBE32|nr:hypothetical protein [Rhodonellum sp.]MDO9554921.1 hypothetical protein [Rhodonellum sp.]